MSVDLVSAALFLAPGFLTLKLFYLFGAQRPRSQWEWTTWSIIASLPLNGAAGAMLSKPVIPQSTPSAPWQPDGYVVALSVALAVGAGCLGAIAWRLVRRSDRRVAVWLRRELTNSAWDQALEDARHKGRSIAVVTDGGIRYRGALKYGGREDAEASGWLYLAWPDKRDQTTGEWTRLRGVHGLLVDRGHLRIVQVNLTKKERIAEGADLCAREAIHRHR